MSSDRRTPNVVRRERPARATTPISAPQLEQLVEGLRDLATTEAAVLQRPDDDDEIEMSVTEQDPAAPERKFAHTVRQSKTRGQ